MKILITGFDPFGGEKINPAWEAVNALPDEVDGVEVIKVQIPTVFKKSAQKMYSPWSVFFLTPTESSLQNRYSQLLVPVIAIYD